MRDQYRHPVNRPLTAEEVALVRWLIAHGTEEAAHYSDQVNRLQVVSECTCGCPTIDLGACPSNGKCHDLGGTQTLRHMTIGRYGATMAKKFFHVRAFSITRTGS